MKSSIFKLLPFIVLFSVDLMALEISSEGKDKTFTLTGVTSDDYDYHEVGENIFLVLARDAVIREKVTLVKKSRKAFVVAHNGEQKWKIGDKVWLEEAKLERKAPPKVEKVFMLAHVGMPFNSKYIGFESAREAYELEKIQGFATSIGIAWYSGSNGSTSIIGGAFYANEISGSVVNSGLKTKAVYTSQGVSFFGGAEPKITEKLSIGIIAEKRFSFSSKMKVSGGIRNINETQPFILIGVDSVRVSLVYDLDSLSSVYLDVDDEIVSSKLIKFLNLNSKTDRTGVSSYKIGYRHEI